MEEFFATLGHEMRNPLSALSYAIEVWPGCEADPIRLGKLRLTMRRQVSQLIRLSDELQDVARIAQGKLQLRREHVSLTRSIEEACEQIRPFIDRCGHAMTVRFPSEPVWVDGDRSRLIQVFANLIQNAAKYTDGNGSLSVTVESQGETAVVRVCDNGQGIEPRLLPSIFDRFVQDSQTIGIDRGGLGLGLTLVKTIVELHGGTVAAESAGSGQGSEFAVHLPRLNDSPHNPQTAAPPHVAGPNRPLSPAYRIVVVDDDRSNRELLARLLLNRGQSVSVAGDGATAVRMVLDERPQVVFLDLMMRDMDGYEVARRLRGEPQLTGLVLIALSGSGDEGSREQAREAGFDNYLVKPASVATLVEALASVPSHQSGRQNKNQETEVLQV